MMEIKQEFLIRKKSTGELIRNKNYRPFSTLGGARCKITQTISNDKQRDDFEILEYECRKTVVAVHAPTAE